MCAQTLRNKGGMYVHTHVVSKYTLHSPVLASRPLSCDSISNSLRHYFSLMNFDSLNAGKVYRNELIFKFE